MCMLVLGIELGRINRRSYLAKVDNGEIDGFWGRGGGGVILMKLGNQEKNMEGE